MGLIRAEMIVPRVDDSDDVEAHSERRDGDQGARVGLVYLGIALVAGLFGFGLGAWGLTRYRRRRS